VTTHELAPDALPTDESGAVGEDGEGIEVIDEIEDVGVDASETVSVALGAVSYVCSATSTTRKRTTPTTRWACALHSPSRAAEQRQETDERQA
jgi:hypothetical protein